ncbi:MAG: CBS domain-containing protein [Pseudomonadota bacterium]
MSRRSVGDLISREAVNLPASATVLEAAYLMAEHKIGAIMVVEEGRLRGIFTERDALFRVIAESRDPAMTPLSGVMTHKLKTATPHMTAVEALLIMRDNNFRHLPVVEHGNVLGIVSLRDFVGAELQEVEEQLLYDTQAATG